VIAKGHSYQTSGPAAWTVELDQAANVMVMDAGNWSAFRAGRPFRYVDGGYVKETPAHVRAPHAGTWWVVVDSPMGGIVRYRIS
jgi:hypothetical protein